MSICRRADALTVPAGQRIEREATFRYQTLTVPEKEAANCVLVNGTLIHRARAECNDACDVSWPSETSPELSPPAVLLHLACRCD